MCHSLQEFRTLSDKFCCPLITFANTLDPDQARQNVGPDLNPNLFDILMVFLKENFDNVNFENKKHAKLPSLQRVYKHLRAAKTKKRLNK